ncbi:MAG: hypothetical protein AAGN35_16330 [Bacteroidota bacterium]
MKGANLVRVILNLTDEEYDHIYQSLPNSSKVDRMRKLLAAIRSMKTTSRKQLAHRLGVAERTVSELLQKLSRHVTFALAHHEPDKSLELELMLATAWKLVFRIENAPAAELMQDLFDLATAHERFDILFDLLKLAEIMTEPAELKGMDKEEITRRHVNLLQYQGLKTKVAGFKLLPEKERIAALEDMEQEPLLQQIECAMSISAQAHFFWTWTRLYYLKENHSAAYRSQKALVELMEENKWLDRYDDFFSPRKIGR